MKTITIALFVCVFTTLGFSQESNYSVSLKPSERFIKLKYSQITDSVNLNQVGPEQFEFLEIIIDNSVVNSIDPFMAKCRSIQDIINKYGTTCLDITIASNSETIRPISGFYYNVETTFGRLRLSILYPRTDTM